MKWQCAVCSEWKEVYPCEEHASMYNAGLVVYVCCRCVGIGQTEARLVMHDDIKALAHYHYLRFGEERNAGKQS